MPIVKLATEPVTETNFAPYGEVLGIPPEDDPVFRGIQASTWPTRFKIEGEARLMFTRFAWQQPRFTRLERHHGITQCFLPVSGHPVVMVVAPPTQGDEPPQPSTVRAFLFAGSQGILLGDGVWHALDRFLLEPDAADFMMITGAAVQAELEAQYRGSTKTPELTDVIDYEALMDITFEIEMPPLDLPDFGAP